MYKTQRHWYPLFISLSYQGEAKLPSSSNHSGLQLKSCSQTIFCQKSTEKLVPTPGKVPNHALFYPTHATNPQNGPIFRLEQTYSFHIIFERDFSAESHFPYQKTSNKPIKQRMHLKSSELFTFLVKKQQNFAHIMQMRSFPWEKNMAYIM